MMQMTHSKDRAFIYLYNYYYLEILLVTGALVDGHQFSILLLEGLQVLLQLEI